MITSALLLLIIAVGVVAIAVLLAYIWTKIPSKRRLAHVYRPWLCLLEALAFQAYRARPTFQLMWGLRPSQQMALRLAPPRPRCSG